MAGLLKPASQKSKIRRLGNQPTDNPGRNPSTRPSPIRAEVLQRRQVFNPVRTEPPVAQDCLSCNPLDGSFPMTKPITPLRQRMLDDMALRNSRPQPSASTSTR